MNPRTRKILMWAGIALLTLQFLAAATGKFTGDWDQKFSRWGYPPFTALVAGVLEVGSVVLLFIPSLRKWGSLLIIVIMAGAMATHLLHAEAPRIIHNMIVAAIALGVLRLAKSMG